MTCSGCGGEVTYVGDYLYTCNDPKCPAYGYEYDVIFNYPEPELETLSE